MTLEFDYLMLNLFFDFWYYLLLYSEHEMSRVLAEILERFW